MKQRTNSLRQLILGGVVLVGLGLNQAAAQQEIWVDGITEPINDVTLSAPLAGIIGTQHQEEGSFVNQGELILELDKSIQELELNRRKLVMDLANKEYERTMKLFETKAISVSAEEMDQKLAEYQVAEAEYKLANEQLRRRQLTAPFDGTVVEILLEEGEACQAQQPLVRLVDTRRCYFVSNIDAELGHALEVGQPVSLQVRAGSSSEQFTGEISYVSPVVDPASGLMRIKAAFENPERKIRPGVAGKMLLTRN